MKITKVEALVLRLPQITAACDGTQDTCLVRGRDRCGHHRLGRGRFLPHGGEGGHRRAAVAPDLQRPGQRRARLRSAGDRGLHAADAAGGQLLRPHRAGRACHGGREHGPVGYRRQGLRQAGLPVARRAVSNPHAGLRQRAVRRHPGGHVRGGAALGRSRLHGGQVRLGTDGAERAERHRPGPRGPPRPGR